MCVFVCVCLCAGMGAAVGACACVWPHVGVFAYMRAYKARVSNSWLKSRLMSNYRGRVVSDATISPPLS